MSESSPDVAAQLIARLDGEAEFVDHGSFTLDRQKARDKLATHRLSDPQTFVVLLVEVAYLLDCERISFERRRGATFAWLEGAQLSAEELGGVFDAAYMERGALDTVAGRRVEARRRLAVCVETALGLPCRGIELRSVGAEGEQLVLRVGPDASTSLSSELDVSDSPGGLSFEMHDLHSALARLTGGDDAVYHARAQALRERCCYASRPVLLDGRHVNGGTQLPEVATPVEIHGPDKRCFGHGGRSPARQRTTLLFVANGVLIEAIELPDAAPGFVALVDAEGLERDLSLFRLRRDAAFDARVVAARQMFDALPPDPGQALRYAPPPVQFSPIMLVVGISVLLFGVTNLILSPFELIWVAVVGVWGGVFLINRARRRPRQHAVIRGGVEAIATIEAVEVLKPNAEPQPRRLHTRIESIGRPTFETSIDVTAWQSTNTPVGARYYARVDASGRVRLEPEPGQRQLL